ncbi:MAG: hypothetical protein PUB61_09825, partial [Bacteroidales bacterium]|nr:hypothetical protein [Bacteroidales bacterium]
STFIPLKRHKVTNKFSICQDFGEENEKRRRRGYGVMRHLRCGYAALTRGYSASSMRLFGADARLDGIYCCVE